MYIYYLILLKPLGVLWKNIFIFFLSQLSPGTVVMNQSTLWELKFANLACSNFEPKTPLLLLGPAAWSRQEQAGGGSREGDGRGRGDLGLHTAPRVSHKLQQQENRIHSILLKACSYCLPKQCQPAATRGLHPCDSSWLGRRSTGRRDGRGGWDSHGACCNDHGHYMKRKTTKSIRPTHAGFGLSPITKQ